MDTYKRQKDNETFPDEETSEKLVESDNFLPAAPETTCWSPRLKAIFLMNGFASTGIIYQALAKMATNSGFSVIDLCFFRTFVNFLLSVFVVYATN